ncbi:N-6 DNA methylase [Natrinema ejinorense]|uniref:Type I restriction endonuclease subunit M n=1 Tax=Natrinema ejinorense TaxID=373386 RepID=A0A2A5QRK5_9EURY|nr:N-6 DNA methylase [Natrinema ejinorense]PCR89452.1 type I restriction endonuclease subunit M [Natrinema ejinorense]
MSNSRESESGRYLPEYHHSQILLSISLEGAERTRDIEDHLGCSNKTALNKLHELHNANVLTATKWGTAYRWQLNTNQPTPPDSPTDLTGLQLPQLLTQVIEQLTEHYLTHYKPLTLTDNVSDWLDKRVNTDRVNPGHYATNSALFNRFLKATLYALYQPEANSLEALSPGADWNSQFEAAANITDNHAFTSSIDTHLPEHPQPIDSLLLALRHLVVQTTNPSEVLADVYEQLISQAARRDLGQFATPNHVSQFMASWAITDPDDTILDPGIGAGQLAYQALRCKMDQGCQTPMPDITGIDVDEIAITMAATALKLADGPGSPNLYQDDFIHFSPVYSGTQSQFKAYDVIIGNPPYSRHQAVDNQSKNNLNTIISEETGQNFSRRTPLYGYFLIHAAQFLREGGRAAFIMPSQFMATDFGIDMKSYLLEHFTIHAIIQLDDSVDIFDGVKTTPSILLLEAGTPTDTHEISFLKLSYWPTDIPVATLLDQPSQRDSHQAVAFHATVAQQVLTTTERWTHYFHETDIQDHPELVEFDTLATVKRGIATGNNSFFCLSQADIDAHNIPPEYRERILKTARGLDKLNITTEDWKQWRDNGDDVWMLYCYDDDGNIQQSDDIESQAVKDYLNHGRKTGVTEGTLVSRRNPWYRVDRRDPPDILGKYMNRNGFQFYRNDADLLTTNNTHTIYLNDEDTLNVFLAYLNSNFIRGILSKRSRNYSGLQKLEISDLEAAPVLDVASIPQSLKSHLSTLFNDLCDARRDPNADDTQILQQIDEAIEAHLEFDAS